MAERAMKPPLPPRRPLRVWPGVAIVMLQWMFRLVFPLAAPDIAAFAVLAGPVGLMALIVWWLFFSRATWPERIGGVVLLIAGMALTPYVLHHSVRDGNMGMQFFIYAPWGLCLAVVAGALLSRVSHGARRRTILAATLVLGCGAWALLRSDGLDGDGAPELAWRWAETAEARVIAFSHAQAPAPVPVGPTDAVAQPAWPGFRGPHRDGSVSGLRVATDWAASPPTRQWRRPVGPAVSSFAVGGALFYTQEQRTGDEIVAAYSVATGEEVWLHRDATRFYDAHVGAGPRATPVLDTRRLYTLGARGNVNALDAVNGSVAWSRNAAEDTGAKVPMFGFTSSPLLVDDMVVVAVSGRLVAYDASTGNLRWTGPEGGGRESYSSPHFLTIDGTPQVLLLHSAGATSVAPADGALLWKHDTGGHSYLQPALTVNGDLLIGEMDFMPSGMRRYRVTQGPGGWTVEERWLSKGLRPHFSDFVVHAGHAYGLDGGTLACIGLADGEQRWKDGRYGHGQLILLRDQSVLLVVTERGELALVAASPEGFSELARLPAIDGRTWNHPALAGDILLVRNGEEMAAFRLARAR